MFDFIRTTAVVPDIMVGNADFNTDRILEYIDDISENDRSNIVVFPELSITGFTCADLFFQSELYNAVLRNIGRILKHTADREGIYLIGAPIKANGQLYNCALVIESGKIHGIVPKTFLPNYNEFYEKRWFSSASELMLNEISSRELCIDDEYMIPMGTDIIFNVGGKCVFGIEICEDLWTPLPPSTISAMRGAEIIFNLSASNETIAKRSYRRSLVSQQSARNMCAYVYCSAGETESTTDLIFSGNSIIAENGSVIAENEKLIDTNYKITADIDLEKIKADRLKYKSFKDSASFYKGMMTCRTVNIDMDYECFGEYLKVNKLPFVPSSKTERLSRCMDIFRMQVAGLKKRASAAGGKLVIGVSGGLDSTLALLVAVETVKAMGKPLENVVGITMPGFGTTGKTYNNSIKLMQALGIEYKEISIADACRQHFKDIGHDENDHSITYENTQARERTKILMNYANKIGGFVVGTGDLSELALGWCTYNADHMSMYGVNASIPKTLVRWMIESVAENEVFAGCRDILSDILDTPISPELLPPDADGNIAQKTEDTVGPYALHDFYLYHMLRYGFSPRKIYYLACRAFENDFDSATILKWLKNFYRRFFTQQFKRSCLPDGVKVGSVCLSPRGDWRMPSDASYGIWMRELEKLSE